MITLSIDDNFLAISDEFSNIENSQIVILPIPYEHSVSYGEGTGKGPNGILKASAYVEFYDDETERELCFEKGIATLEPIDFGDIVDNEAMELIESNVQEILDLNKFVVSLGGEHTISAPIIKAHFAKYPNMCLLHFDAHSDLRESYEDSIYSHASVMSRVAEFFPTERMTQVGIRAQCIEEALFIKDNNIKTFYASAIKTGKHGDNWIKSVV